MRRWLTICALGLLCGACTTATVLPADPTKMSAEQLAAFSKIKDVSVWCLVFNSPYGKGSGLALNLDKGVLVNGTVTIDDACKASITNNVSSPK